jgi:hypothetical protein
MVNVQPEIGAYLVGACGSIGVAAMAGRALLDDPTAPRHGLVSQPVPFAVEAARVLSGGVLVGYTADHRSPTQALEAAGWSGIRPLVVIEAGGLQVRVFRVAAPPSNGRDRSSGGGSGR